MADRLIGTITGTNREMIERPRSKLSRLVAEGAILLRNAPNKRPELEIYEGPNYDASKVLDWIQNHAIDRKVRWEPTNGHTVQPAPEQTVEILDAKVWVKLQRQSSTIQDLEKKVSDLEDRLQLSELEKTDLTNKLQGLSGQLQESEQLGYESLEKVAGLEEKLIRAEAQAYNSTERLSKLQGEFSRELAAIRNQVNLPKPRDINPLARLVQYTQKARNLDEKLHNVSQSEKGLTEHVLATIKGAGLPANSLSDVEQYIQKLYHDNQAKANRQKLFEEQKSQETQEYNAAKTTLERLQTQISDAQKYEDKDVSSTLVATIQTLITSTQKKITSYQSQLAAFDSQIEKILKPLDASLQKAKKVEAVKAEVAKLDCSKLPIYVDLEQDPDRNVYNVYLPVQEVDSTYSKLITACMGSELEAMGATKSIDAQTKLCKYYFNVSKKEFTTANYLALIWQGVLKGYRKTGLNVLGITPELEFRTMSQHFDAPQANTTPDVTQPKPSLYDVVKGFVTSRQANSIYHQEITEHARRTGATIKDVDIQISRLVREGVLKARNGPRKSYELSKPNEI